MVHHLSVLPQQRVSELEYEDRVRVECVQGREGRALPVVDWCLILASGFRVSESPTEPWRGTPSCPHAPGSLAETPAGLWGRGVAGVMLKAVGFPFSQAP